MATAGTTGSYFCSDWIETDGHRQCPPWSARPAERPKRSLHQGVRSTALMTRRRNAYVVLDASLPGRVSGVVAELRGELLQRTDSTLVGAPAPVFQLLHQEFVRVGGAAPQRGEVLAHHGNGAQQRACMGLLQDGALANAPVEPRLPLQPVLERFLRLELIQSQQSTRPQGTRFLQMRFAAGRWRTLPVRCSNVW